MTDIDMDHCFRKNEQIICKEFTDGPALIDPYRRTLIRLNPTAQDIWRLLDQNRSVTGIVNELKEIYDTEAEELRRDVVSFLECLISREMIV